MCKNSQEPNNSTDKVRTAIYVRSSTSNAPSSTPIEKRTGLMTMLNDCKDGKIDLILTKDASRLGKNPLDYKAVLQQIESIYHKVDVYFDNEKHLIEQPNNNDRLEG